MTYFGTRLSGNISRRDPEGYLICLNVPVARTGTQEYLPSELGLPEPDARLIPVFRPPEEVFSPACMASFEGMPVTDGHPRAAEGVTAENSRFLQKGHAHNVRRAPAPDDDLLLADLIVTDPDLIAEILAGKREISCGYTYTLAEENGRYIQREIRGNHVAVVDAGRAGPRVSIKDERRTPGMKNRKLAKVLARMARDGEAEEVAEILEEILDPTAESPGTGESGAGAPAAAPAAAVPEAPAEGEAPEDRPEAADHGAEILAALNRIIALLSAPAPADGAEPLPSSGGEPEEDEEESIPEAAEAAEAAAETAAAVLAGAAAGAAEAESGDDPVDVLVAEILETGSDPGAGEEAEILSALTEPETDEDPEDREICTADALRAALAAFRPQLRKMSPAARRRFNADVAARLRKLERPAAGTRSAYASLRPAAARDLAARSLGQKIMAGRNANLRTRPNA